MAGAALCPGRGLVVGQQQQEVVRGLQGVDLRADAAFDLAGAVVTLPGQARLLQGLVELRGIHHAHPGRLAVGTPRLQRQLRRQALRQRGQVDAGRDRQQRQHHRPRQIGPRRLRLHAVDQLAGHQQRQPRAGRQQLVEGRLAQPHQHRIAHRHHRGRARLVGVEAHLADDLAARHLAHRALVAVVAAHIGAQPAAEGEVHRVARFTLLHQGVAAGHGQPVETLRQQRQGIGLERAQQGMEMAVKQFVLKARLHGTEVGLVKTGLAGAADWNRFRAA
jgi:hypothetical protein